MTDLLSYKKKLILYAGDPTSITNITTRQKEAIEKMVFLNKYQFDDLVIDISNEIDYRLYGMEPEPLTDKTKLVTRNKLRLLDEHRFKELTLDVLLVMEHRIPFIDQNPGTKTLINDIEEILYKLKSSKTLEESFYSKLDKSQDFLESVSYFLDYLERKFKQSDTNTSVLDKFRGQFDKYESTIVQTNYHSLFSINKFLIFIEQYETTNSEFCYRKNNLEKMLETKQEIPEKILLREISEIFYIILQEKRIFSVKTKNILKEDATNLMRSLEEFVSAIKLKAEKEELMNLGTSLLTNSDIFYDKLTDQELNIDQSLSEKYQKQHNKIEIALKNNVNENQLFNSVIEFVYFIKELFSIVEID
ncbi:hypothetical protein TUBRATIS_002470 [Tubulinosema ratisbonensis]|uniref:GIT Spa2 homology (SHD) domain-containing protein n=1 Tax=Tubulinosema ratisbonensis TaxID=291195 RepID=A0A437AQ59_9MICR|nr:hypothetical protein TUBRATIS_002470 [Tubulinosema ratisbonensis]